MNILIAGIGAIGSNLASLLARDLDDKWTITALDKDTVEERNIRAGTQFYTKDQIGLSKTEALEFNIYQAHGREIKTINGPMEELNADYILGGFIDGIVVDCFDNKEARTWIHSRAYHRHIAALHVGFSNDFTFAIEWNKNYQVPDNEVTFDICETTGAASFVNYVAALASQVVIENVSTSQQLDIVGNRFTSRRIV